MTTVYGIKNCDSVKKAQQYLTQRDQAFTFHDFRTDGLDETLVRCFLDQLGLDKVINKRSTTWKQLDEHSKTHLNQDSAIALCLEHPTLIKRPVLEHNGQYFIGFKADDYAAIFAHAL
ncbi:MAG: ArsC family reductase [Pseudomonadales bacterium]|nr:ArsC family reductase [Pseudomonadales bacterium]